jgi:hypothetical protein
VSTVTICHALFTEMLLHQMTYYDGALGDVTEWIRGEAPLHARLLEEDGQDIGAER